MAVIEELEDWECIPIFDQLGSACLIWELRDFMCWWRMEWISISSILDCWQNLRWIECRFQWRPYEMRELSDRWTIIATFSRTKLQQNTFPPWTTNTPGRFAWVSKYGVISNHHPLSWMRMLTLHSSHRSSLLSILVCSIYLLNGTTGPFCICVTNRVQLASLSLQYQLQFAKWISSITITWLHSSCILN